MRHPSTAAVVILGLLPLPWAPAAPDPERMSSRSAGCATADLSRRSAEGAEAEHFWPQWRGPYASGVSKYAEPPVEWSETKNVRWKVEVPGRGSASPVVWGDRIFLLSAVPVGVAGAAEHQPRGGLRSRGAHRFVVLAIDRRTGRILWQQTAREEVPHE